ncbi:MAG: hypothetical protein P3B98_04950 [Gemmatimonadota bacterium]|nr:hypothetical protein [Gemmatimonadota bacterium]
MVVGLSTSALSTTRSLSAQQPFAFVPRVQPEWRADLVAARNNAFVAMVGANVPLGYYARAGAALGAGAVWRAAGPALAARINVTTRFLLDPFGENAWGPYLGGGLTARRDGWDRADAGLLLVLGVEGRRRTGWMPSAEVALGQGARLGVVLRKARRNGR